MTVFVTGGTGFLGGHFIREAVLAGLNIRALRRKESGSSAVENAGVEWITGDMASCADSAFSGCDTFVHLAAKGVSPQVATLEEMMKVNVSDSLGLWRRAIDAGVKRLVVCGSCFEYGASAAEHERIPVTAALLPVEPYGASKAAATMAALGLAAVSRCELIVLRPFHFYGDGQYEGNFWPALRKAAHAGDDFRMSPGGQIRDFAPVETIASAFVHACLRKDSTPGKPVIENVGSGLPVSMETFAQDWWLRWSASGKLMVGALPYRSNEVMRFIPELPR